jgi:hypothetical protein
MWVYRTEGCVLMWMSLFQCILASRTLRPMLKQLCTCMNAVRDFLTGLKYPTEMRFSFTSLSTSVLYRCRSRSAVDTCQGCCILVIAWQTWPNCGSRAAYGYFEALGGKIRHGPHWKRRVQQFFYCCMCIRYRGNVSTEPLPSKDREIFTEALSSNDGIFFYRAVV